MVRPAFRIAKEIVNIFFVWNFVLKLYILSRYHNLIVTDNSCPSHLMLAIFLSENNCHVRTSFVNLVRWLWKVFFCIIWVLPLFIVRDIPVGANLLLELVHCEHFPLMQALNVALQTIFITNGENLVFNSVWSLRVLRSSQTFSWYMNTQTGCGNYVKKLYMSFTWTSQNLLCKLPRG